MRIMKYTFALVLIGLLSSCGGDVVIDTVCDEPQLYQSVAPGKRLQVPEGLDPLNELAEMPIPSAEGAPERPPGSRCIELPPRIGTSSN